MPIPFLSSINLTKNEVENFKIYNLANDPGTLTSGGDFGYFWLNTSSQKTLKWWDGANVRSIVDSTNIGSYTSGLATDLAGGAGGYLPYQAGTNDTTFLPLGTAAQILAVNSGITGPEWINQSSMSVGSATTATTANAVANALTAGSYLTSGGTYNGSVARTFAVDATDANTASKVVARDASGNFAAGTITAAKVTGLSAPTAGSDAANRDYVDSVAQGLDVKASCKAATVSNINLASPGATIDTVSLSVDNRVLVKDQSAPAENGIYLWKGAAVAMVRSPDADTWDDLVGAFTFVEEGTSANADSGWVCSVNAGGTLGSTAVTWVKFSQAGSYTPGNGIVQSGTSFNFAQSTPYTAGQIPFAKDADEMTFSANLHWDNGNNRLGIGTATPGARLTVADASPTIRLNDTNTSVAGGVFGTIDWLSQDSSMPGGLAAKIDVYDDLGGYGDRGAIRFFTNNGTSLGERMVLTSSGNLGLGVTPSAWGYSGVLQTDKAALLGLGNSMYLGNNWRYSAGVSYKIATGYAFVYEQNRQVGSHIFYTSSTGAGSAGDTITFNPLMTLDASGNLGIGTTTPQAKLDVIGKLLVAKTGTAQTEIDAFETAQFRGSAVAYIRTSGGSVDGIFGSESGAGSVFIGSYTNHPFVLRTNNTERLRIASDGVFTWSNVGGVAGTAMTLNGTGLGVGTATPANKIDAQGVIRAFATGAVEPGVVVDYGSSNGYGGFFIHVDGSRKWRIGSVGDTNATPALNFWQEGAGSRMLISSGGNLGIGTATPAHRLNVVRTGDGITAGIAGGTYGIRFDNGGTFSSGMSTIHGVDSTLTGSYQPIMVNGSDVRFGIAGNLKMLLDSSGNLGLGVTPSAWGTGYWAVQAPYASGLFGNKNAPNIVIGTNVYLNNSGQPIYHSNNQPGASYELYNGAHIWYNAPNSGASGAGTVATFTQRMTLDASGNLCVGTAAAKNTASGRGNITIEGTGSAILNLSVNNTDTGYILHDGTNIALDNRANGYLRIKTNDTERIRIKSTGQVNFVGLASDPAGAAGDVVYNSTSNRLKYHNGTAWVDSGTRKVSVVGGAGTGTYIDATHNFNTKTVSVTVLRTTDNVVVYTDVAMTNDNTVRVTFASSVTLADYTVTVIG